LLLEGLVILVSGGASGIGRTEERQNPKSIVTIKMSQICCNSGCGTKAANPLNAQIPKAWKIMFWVDMKNKAVSDRPESGGI
jgi:hypothetical protein